MASAQGNWESPINGLTTFFLVLVILFLLLRLFTRIFIVHAFWWDDFTIILAVVGNTIGAGLDFVETSNGFGRHQQFLSPHQLLEFRKYTYGEWIQTFATLMWTKVSICLFLMRIPRIKALRRTLQWAVAFLLFSNTILTTAWIMQCQPLHAAWDDQGTCMSREALQKVVLVQAVISVVSDFSFAILPIVFLWRVQIDLKTKLGLWTLMCLGFITGAFCLVRTILNDEALPLDRTYDGIINWIWRLFEVTIGIIAACIPTLRPLYNWSSRKLKGEKTDQNIKWSLTSHSKKWSEHAEEAGPSGSEVSKEPVQAQDMLNESRLSPPRDRRRDTMRDDLVAQGIIKTEANDVENTKSGTNVQRKDDMGLTDDMQKYGIDDIA
ncbi:hypothetical protein G7Y79_00074g098660 [Physcia stellaris]|nr:hypothetical protein G7Y79_00074g098660 [Physcia stellaris]